MERYKMMNDFKENENVYCFLSFNNPCVKGVIRKKETDKWYTVTFDRETHKIHKDSITHTKDECLSLAKHNAKEFINTALDSIPNDAIALVDYCITCINKIAESSDNKEISIMQTIIKEKLDMITDNNYGQ